ncbi:E1 ubiquitin-activating protein UBA2 [Sporobolomyces salmoneus]|uniref:E1 ubiquitin-activating protein UBA2 n=1 Tax=Sporobolomyces salmoneus TaxID=183962 RepID=UPI003174833E
MTEQDRYASPRAVLGDALFDKLVNSKVLVVGAGGIGCELLKNMVMTGFGSGEKGSIELLDLDTIDLSNLNRQFLFQKQHVKRPKSIVARETALKFNPNVKITALHRNIKDTDFNVDYFKSFDFVMNALDNLDARRHVNKMCLASNIPLIESGTSGYRGQVQPIKGNTTDCFDCTGKPVPKTFAVCTIRSTPSTAHHCIAWAKSYLFPQLFGADDESDQQELDDAEKNGENVDEIQELRKEALAVRELRSTLTQPGAAQRIFEKVYRADIERLLQMTDMWKHRNPPHSLSYGDLSESVKERKEQANGSAVDANGGIKDQRKLSLEDSFELFIASVERLQKRIDPSGANPLSFDKDDDDTLDFVVASANLRASAFEIESQTRFQVKEYAGNIIPAIATTNAIIAGAIVLQALAHLRSDWSSARSVWLNRQSDKIFDVGPCSTPNPYCAVCRIVYVPVRFKRDVTLGEFVKAITGGEGSKLSLGGEEERVSIMEGSRLLFETEDFEDNGAETLEKLGCGVGKFLTVENDDDDWPISFSIGSFLPDDSTEKFDFDLSAYPSTVPKKPAPPPSAEEEAAKESKDADDDITFAIDDADEIMIIEPANAQTLQQEAIAGQTGSEEPGRITGKKRRANEAGLEESPAKKEKKVETEKEGEKEVEVVDLT